MLQIRIRFYRRGECPSSLFDDLPCLSFSKTFELPSSNCVRFTSYCLGRFPQQTLQGRLIFSRDGAFVQWIPAYVVEFVPVDVVVVVVAKDPTNPMDTRVEVAVTSTPPSVP